MARSMNWQVTTMFPEFGGAAYNEHWQRLESGLERLEAEASALGAMTPDNAREWAQVLVLDEELMQAYSHVGSYVGCLAAAHAKDETYAAEQGRLSALAARFTKAFAPVLAALRTVEDAAFDALLARPELEGAQYALTRLREEAGRTMDPALEVLTAELNVDGLWGWGRLYDDLSSKLEFPMPTDDGEERMTPMAQKRSLLEDPDPEVRRQALESSNRAWESVEHVAAACLNHISGTRLTLNRHRGVDDFLTIPCFDAAVDKATVEAMWAEAAKGREIAWRYGRLKAKLLGRKQLGFQDLPAPLPEKLVGREERRTWDQAVDLVLSAFDAAYPALGGFAREMVDQGRVESEKRPAKRPGAFCTTSLQTRESRVFMTFGGGLGDVKTLAHELGHAFHSRILRDERPFASRYPMTLAETASTFAERLLQDRILDDPATPDKVRAAVLASRLDDALTFLCDIPMRYFFEQSFYEERKSGEVKLSRIKELMLAAQDEWFGDVLDQDQRDPMFWASKLHFYITGVAFYNFPYSFGYLLSLWIASEARSKGQAFLPRYEDFLRATGSATAEEGVRATLGRDLRDPAFWRQGFSIIADDLKAFEELAG